LRVAVVNSEEDRSEDIPIDRLGILSIPRTTDWRMYRLVDWESYQSAIGSLLVLGGSVIDRFGSQRLVAIDSLRVFVAMFVASLQP
jgi:hypothetical protein